MAEILTTGFATRGQSQHRIVPTSQIFTLRDVLAVLPSIHVKTRTEQAAPL